VQYWNGFTGSGGPMENWQDFFVAELGAAAAFAGLLFVSLSVNEARILQFGGLAERGLQALTSLFLVFVVATCALTPDQTPQRLGAETLVASVLQIAFQTCSQFIGHRLTEKAYRRSLLVLALVAQFGSGLFVAGSLMMIVRGDWLGLQTFVPGTIIAFGMSGVVAWVLLVEINR
jgi:hypothetical protein